MGYLIAAHIVNGEPDLSRLSELPTSIGWRAYRHASAGVTMLDTFRAGNVPDWPFQQPLPTTDISLDLSPEFSSFEALYGQLYKLDLANSFKKSYINFALLCARLLDNPVLSIISDDDELDFGCVASSGDITRLAARCGDMIVTLKDGRPHIQPLVPEFEEDAEFLTDTAALKKAVPDLVVAERNVDWPSQLHAVAIQEWQAFSGSQTHIPGLGSFDPPEDESEWELLASS